MYRSIPVMCHIISNHHNVRQLMASSMEQRIQRNVKMYFILLLGIVDKIRITSGISRNYQWDFMQQPPPSVPCFAPFFSAEGRKFFRISNWLKRSKMMFLKNPKILTFSKEQSVSLVLKFCEKKNNARKP